MDHFDKLNLQIDSTIRLAWEAVRLGHKLYFFEPKNLMWKNSQVTASIQTLELEIGNSKFYKLGEPKTISLEEMDIILLRQDPPFNMQYLTTTYLLEKLTSTKVINNPKEIRNSPEKLLVLDFPDLTPPTLLTQNLKEAYKFLKKHDKIVLKPLYEFGGNDIHLVEDNTDLEVIFDTLLGKYKESIILQRFIPEVKQGDKRIIIIDGEPVGAVLRVPEQGSIISNFAAGGSGKKIELSENDLKICKTIAPTLKERGLIFVGIDVIGNYLTEINVTSPTGIIAIDVLNDTNIAAKFWQAVL